MQSKNPFLADIARSGQALGGIIHEIKKEVDNMVQQKITSYMNDSRNPHHDELELLKDMVTKARIEQEKINERLDKIEATLDKD